MSIRNMPDRFYGLTRGLGVWGQNLKWTILQPRAVWITIYIENAPTGMIFYWINELIGSMNQ